MILNQYDPLASCSNSDTKLTFLISFGHYTDAKSLKWCELWPSLWNSDQRLWAYHTLKIWATSIAHRGVFYSIRRALSVTTRRPRACYQTGARRQLEPAGVPHPLQQELPPATIPCRGRITMDAGMTQYNRSDNPLPKYLRIPYQLGEILLR